MKALDAFGFALATASSTICIYCMATAYTISGGIMSPNKVYTSLMVLNFARIWGIFFFHSGRMGVTTAKVMKKRLEDVLHIKDVLSIEEAHQDVLQNQKAFAAGGSQSSSPD